MDPVLRQRLITAGVLLPFVALLPWLPRVVLIAVAITVFMLIHYEYFSFATTLSMQRKLQLSVANLVLPLAFLFYGWGGVSAGVLLCVMLVFGVMVLIVELEKHQIVLENLVPAVFLGFCYVGILGTSLVVAASGENAGGLLTWLLFVVIFSDTAAYFVGRNFGGPRLSPRISPNKTLSGGVGGLIGAVIGSFLGAEILGFSAGALSLLGYGLVGGVLAQMGDLVECLIQRIYGVKDSGNLLPGHGGLLDRIDALLFAVPVLFFVKFVVV